MHFNLGKIFSFGRKFTSPIVEIHFQTNETVIPNNFVKIEKNLNKSSVFGPKLFLTYRRQENPSECEIQGLEICFTNIDERKRLSLQSCGYRVVFTFSTGMFTSSQIWMLGGENKEENQIIS